MNLYRTGHNKEPLGIYIHIPFCVKKCEYCDFLSMPADDSVKKKYIENLGMEIRRKVNAHLFEKYELKTIFIGGGTPTALPAEQLEMLGTYIDYILRKNNESNGSVSDDNINYNNTDESIENDEITDEKNANGNTLNYGIEITIECNPGTLDMKKAQILKKHGINRVSLGLQSANDEELKMLGRIHDFDDFVEAYTILQEVGIDNINVDLMSALPLQTAETWEKTLRSVAELSPMHISAYSLIIEEGTPFFEKFSEDDEIRFSGGVPNVLPSEETEREMYEITEKVLAEFGYERYEISNYAKSGMQCRHNIGYWKGKEYLGLGLGAVSMMRHGEGYARYNVTRDLKKYLNGDFEPYDIEELTREIRMEEFIFLGLRMTEGFLIKDFYDRFGVSIYEIYGNVLQKMIDENLLLIKADKKVFLTKKGLDLSNYVFEQFMF